LKYNPLEKTPDWVEKNIIDASGFGVFSGVWLLNDKIYLWILWCEKEIR
jgi:hypothetical protein